MAQDAELRISQSTQSESLQDPEKEDQVIITAVLVPVATLVVIGIFIGCVLKAKHDRQQRLSEYIEGKIAYRK